MSQPAGKRPKGSKPPKLDQPAPPAAPDTPAAGPPPAAPAAPPSPAALVLTERTELREAISKIRDRADKSAKLIGAVAVALAGYLGVTKLDQIFPFHVVSPNGWVIFGFVLSVALLVCGIAAWIGMLQRVGAPIALRPATPEGGAGSDDPNGFSDAEVRLVTKVFTDHARLNGYDTIEEYEQAINDARRVSTGAPRKHPGVALPPGDVDVLGAEVQVVLVRAAADVVRSRYRDAFTSTAARWAMGCAVLGYVGLALSTAFLAGRSAGQVDRAKECAALVKAQREAKLTPEELQSCSGLVPGIQAPAPAAGTSPETTP